MRIRVFLADDHAVVRDGLRALLEGLGDMAVVGEAGDGREAVDRICALSPDVAVLDVAMPGLNGIEAASHLRECCPSVRVVILSMHGSAEHVFRALRAGVFGYLLKESAGRQVALAIRAAANGQTYLDAGLGPSVLLRHDRRGEGACSPLERLSAREREVLQLVVEGHSSADLAETLFLSPKTVETYRSRLMHKLDVRDLPSLVKFAVECGLTPPR
ncbi:MAG: response regulator transcription factor [Deltaproteobacteria bacterium]|nr:response regulator transcription factor [Deltaproteobacteria bacterium]